MSALTLADELGASRSHLFAVEVGRYEVPAGWAAKVNALFGTHFVDPLRMRRRTEVRQHYSVEMLRRELVRRIGHCQSCGLDPMQRFGVDPNRLLEVYFPVPLSEASNDTFADAFLLCPTCHRVARQLPDARERLLANSPFRSTQQGEVRRSSSRPDESKKVEGLDEITQDWDAL